MKIIEISLTGFAINSGRFRLGYSYDLTWGGRNIYAFTTGSAPGVRLQWDRGGNYVFAGAKTAVGDYVDPVSRRKNNQAYYGGLFGAGLMVGDNLKLEAGSGVFQQGQILNVDDTLSEHYGALIMAYGGAAKSAGVVGRICRSLNRPIFAFTETVPNSHELHTFDILSSTAQAC